MDPAQLQSDSSDQGSETPRTSSSSSSTNPVQLSSCSEEVAPTGPTPTLTPSACIDNGRIVNGENFTDQERLRILDTPWTASEGFQWPYMEKKEKGKMRRKFLGPQHFCGPYETFAFSSIDGGIYCKACVLFAPTSVRGVQLKRLNLLRSLFRSMLTSLAKMATIPPT